MDNLRPLVLVLAVVSDFGFWEGVGRAVGAANIPHTAADMGQCLAVAVMFLASQLFQWWRTRHAVRSQVGRALSGHLVRRRRVVKPAVGPK